MSDVYAGLIAVSPVEGADLSEFLRLKGVQVAHQPPAPGDMGSVEVVSVALTSVLGARGLMLVLREWVRARRTTLVVRAEDGSEFELSTSATDKDLLELIGHLQRPSATTDE